MAVIPAYYLFGSIANMVKLRAFKFVSVVHLYWGYKHRRNYEAVEDNILKMMIF